MREEEAVRPWNEASAQNKAGASSAAQVTASVLAALL